MPKIPVHYFDMFAVFFCLQLNTVLILEIIKSLKLF